MRHPGAVLADFRSVYGITPEAVPLHEAFPLLSQLVKDPRTRTSAALHGLPMPLEPLLLLRLTAGVLGRENVLPQPSEAPEEKLSTSEMEAARDYLTKHSVIAQLPD